MNLKYIIIIICIIIVYLYIAYMFRPVYNINNTTAIQTTTTSNNNIPENNTQSIISEITPGLNDIVLSMDCNNIEITNDLLLETSCSDCDSVCNIPKDTIEAFEYDFHQVWIGKKDFLEIKGLA